MELESCDCFLISAWECFKKRRSDVSYINLNLIQNSCSNLVSGSCETFSL